MPGTLFVVATPIGNLEDITLRALRVLREVGIIAAEDTRRTAHLLARHAITTPTTSLHTHNESAKADALIERLRRGEHVAVVSDAGTPTVADPGSRLIRKAIDAGIRVEPVPGPSAVLAALAASGFETTRFTFLGFPPTKVNDRRLWFERAVEINGIAIFFEAPHRIEATLSDLKRFAGDCEVAIGRELTKVHETMVRGHISQVIQSFNGVRGELTIVADLHDRGEVPREDVDLVAEFGEMTVNKGLTKRQAIGMIARRHGMAPNDVYARLEEAKKSGK